MRVYLAGPMTGLPDLNFPAFHAAARTLREHGLAVVNPAELNPDQSASWTACMRRDLAELVTCDAIALLPGWHRSRGAKLERLVAGELGLWVWTVEWALEQAQLGRGPLVQRGAVVAGTVD